jgi:hypothetical protein
LISLSLLLTSHLRIFQHPRVRSSTACYRSFNLLISRSPPLRVYCRPLIRAIRTRFPFASAPGELRLAADNNSQTHYAKGKRSPPCGGSHTLYAIGFRIYFTPLTGVLFTVPSRYYSLSVASEYLALSGGPDGFMQSFTCTALLGIPRGEVPLRAPGCHGLWPIFPDRCARVSSPTLGSRNPGRINPSGLGCSAFARHY